MPAAPDLARMRPLDPSASTPLWRQLKQVLRDLAAFHLQPGERIPSESELCDHFRLSRVTVRQAITSLVNSGVLHRQHGRGTFVLPRRATEPLADPDHFLTSSFDTAPAGELQVYSAESVPADEWAAEKLGGSAGESVHKVRVLLCQHEQPVAYRVSWVLSRRCPGLLTHDLSQPLHRLFEQHYELRLAEADETVECVLADQFRAELLCVPLHHPLMVVQRLVYLDTGDIIAFSRAYYRADHFQLRRHLTRTRAGSADVVPVLVGNLIDNNGRISHDETDTRWR
jgi:DNA-binding GntR family transcriptional regulator